MNEISERYLEKFFLRLEKTEDFKEGLSIGDVFEEVSKGNFEVNFHGYEIEKFLYLKGLKYKTFKERGRMVNRWNIKLVF